MDERDELPRIVVKPSGQPPPGVWKKRRHPAKVGMLIALVLWPLSAVVITLIVWLSSLSGTQLQNDGQLYSNSGFGYTPVSAGSLLVGAAICGGTSSTMVFGAVLFALWVFWFATKPD